MSFRGELGGGLRHHHDARSVLGLNLKLPRLVHFERLITTGYLFLTVYADDFPPNVCASFYQVHYGAEW